ncbi:MAG: hypothetical protein ACW98D_18330, partial [Promethearchaeota archaeon]
MIKLGWKKLILTSIIVIIILSTYIVMIEQSERNGNKINDNEDHDIFTISIDKSIFNLSEPIDVTFQLVNNLNKTTNVSILWPYINLNYQLWDSSGRMIRMYPESGPQYPPSTEVGPKEVYQKTYDIKHKLG